MSDPELFKNLIPDSILKNAQIEVSNNEDLKERFAMVLRGFEEFNLQEFFIRYKYDFEIVLQDLFKCIQCDGNCKSSIYVSCGVQIYQAIDYNYIKIYHRPVFIATVCPGVAERKRQIKEQLTTGKVIASETVTPNQNTSEQFAKCKERLMKSKVVSLDKKRQEREWD